MANCNRQTAARGSRCEGDVVSRFSRESLFSCLWACLQSSQSSRLCFSRARKLIHWFNPAEETLQVRVIV